MEMHTIESPDPLKTPPRKTVALVLGSGSSRGWAHIGAIEALEEEGIPIDFISGCSVGSYVGAVYASGSLASLKDFVLSMDGKKVFSYFDVVFPRSGLLDGTKKVAELFSMHTSVQRFSELNIPVMMVATDLQRGEKVVLRSGNLLQALRATMSVPGPFRARPVQGSLAGGRGYRGSGAGGRCPGHGSRRGHRRGPEQRHHLPPDENTEEK